jgi:ferredoxin
MYHITADCDRCGFCVLECPCEAIEKGREINRILPEKCTECGACVDVCPLGVIVRRPVAGESPAAPAG